MLLFSVKNTRRDLFILTYGLFIALFAIALFLYGFFPIKYDDNAVATMYDVPDHVEHVRVKTDELYRPMVKKVVFIVIDALRWDFLIGPFGTSAMPITSNLISKNSTCLMQARANPPTVTMPRIKAMMTGAVPSFIDVALNFGDLPVSGDSLLLQATNHGHKMNFYGDDTWLKIFPGMFQRFEGTTSFFVNDFTEVDDNVTRHLANELSRKDDWSLLFLHYLGLDHIGHVTGPFSPLVKPKLREMDNIIGQIQGEIENWNDNGLPAILVICGDHGMKDTGGHGGSTAEETLVPFLVVGTSCSSNIDVPNRMSQVDIASSLSVLLGIPIPSSNIGSIPLNLLNDRSDSSKLFILYYNSQQVLKHFKKVPDYKFTHAYENYVNAVKLHVDWLTNKEEKTAVDAALILYNEAFHNMKELLIQSMIDYDLHTMTIAMIFMAHAVHIMANGQNYKVTERKEKFYWIVSSIFSYFILRFIWESENRNSVLKSTSFLSSIITIGIIILNSNLFGTLKFSSSIKGRFLNVDFQGFFFPLGMIVHMISLASSSFVEEEHQTWYFFWTTFLILLIIDTTRKSYNVKLAVKIFFVLLGHRIARKLNSGGNKYAHLPDIANWLRDQENNAAMTIFLLGALGLLVWIGYVCEDKKYKRKTLIFHIGAGICIYLRHMTSETVTKLPFYFNSRGIAEVRIFWTIITFYSLHWANRLIRIPERKVFTNSLLRFIVQLWIIISAILHRPHNVVLLPMQLLVSSVIHDALRTYESKDFSTYIYMWMGNVFYFYQGNSNSLATIDVAAGYVGMESYRPLITGIFLSINTYSAPVLAYLTLVYHSVQHEETKSYSKMILYVNRNCALWRFLPLALYTIIVTIQRFHLFVWTVFSPKLLYEAMYCLVMFTFFVSMQILLYLSTSK